MRRPEKELILATRPFTTEDARRSGWAAVSTFAHEIYKVPRSWAEQAYPNLIYFNELDRGNHFAAWQEPALFAAELRAAFGSLR